MGPRKPQRNPSNNNTQREWDEYDLLPAASPTPAHRLYLETSFTSLQSPSAAPSVASSITNGYHSTISQPSPVPLTNIMLLEDSSRSRKEIPVTVQINITKPKSLSLNLIRQHCESVKHIDLIHDDWFGLAPLASPESLSEVSSISSRASFTTNLDRIQPLSYSYELKTPKVMRRTPKIAGNLSTCADDIRSVRYFQKLGQMKYLRRPSQNGSSVTNSSSNLSFESATSSRCEEHPMESRIQVKIPETAQTSGESDDFQSAEDILDSVIMTAGCADFFSSKPTFLETHFDECIFEEEPAPKPSPSILSPSTPQETDPDLISNFAIDLNLPQQHQSLQFNQRNQETSKPNSVDSGSICRTPSEPKNVTFNPQVINIETSYTSRSPNCSPRRTKKSDRWHLLPLRSKNVKKEPPKIPKPEQVPKTILCSKRRNSDDDFFSRTEALPLLSGLSGGHGEKTSPNFVRRKKYVYPAVTVLTKNESSV